MYARTNLSSDLLSCCHSYPKWSQSLQQQSEIFHLSSTIDDGHRPSIQRGRKLQNTLITKESKITTDKNDHTEAKNTQNRQKPSWRGVEKKTQRDKAEPKGMQN